MLFQGDAAENDRGRVERRLSFDGGVVRAHATPAMTMWRIIAAISRMRASAGLPNACPPGDIHRGHRWPSSVKMATGIAHAGCRDRFSI
jgi:hypothetical protein